MILLYIKPELHTQSFLKGLKLKNYTPDILKGSHKVQEEINLTLLKKKN